MFTATPPKNQLLSGPENKKVAEGKPLNRVGAHTLIRAVCRVKKWEEKSDKGRERSGDNRHNVEYEPERAGPYLRELRCLETAPGEEAGKRFFGVSEKIVRIGMIIDEEWHEAVHHAVHRDNAPHLGEEMGVVKYMLQDVKEEYCVRRTCWKRKRVPLEIYRHHGSAPRGSAVKGNAPHQRAARKILKIARTLPSPDIHNEPRERVTADAFVHERSHERLPPRDALYVREHIFL